MSEMPTSQPPIEVNVVNNTLAVMVENVPKVKVDALVSNNHPFSEFGDTKPYQLILSGGKEIKVTIIGFEGLWAECNILGNPSPIPQRTWINFANVVACGRI